LSYFPRGLVNIRVLEVDLKYENICNASEIARLGKHIAIVALTGLEKMEVTIPLLGEETRDKIAMSAMATAWKMSESLLFERLSSNRFQNYRQSRILRLLSNGRQALRLVSESLSRSMQSKGLSGRIIWTLWRYLPLSSSC
jgi:hypothetical protein